MSKEPFVFDEISLLTWLRLSLTPRIGIRTLLKILARYSLRELAQFGRIEWDNLGLSSLQIDYLQNKSFMEAERCIRWRDECPHHEIIPYLDIEYPALLREISSAPCTLFTAGEIAVLSQPQIAMVGSRNASSIGSQTARQFAADFSQNGLVVTSGLALGIDGCAHDGALNVGGKTIAVLGAGICHIYPSRHKPLAQRVEEQGILVSEFAPHIKPRAEYFPRRNRIISGLSVGVLVVEAAEKSGSLITAKYAADQGRDVFVIPGSIHQASCRGSNELIRNGAMLVQTSEQIFDEVSHLVNWSLDQASPRQNELFPVINTQEELPFPKLLANLGGEATPVDIIAARTHIPVQEAMIQLLELELNGHVESVAGGYILRGRG
jgi:DNA processing protein